MHCLVHILKHTCWPIQLCPELSHTSIPEHFAMCTICNGRNARGIHVVKSSILVFCPRLFLYSCVVPSLSAATSLLFSFQPHASHFQNTTSPRQIEIRHWKIHGLVLLARKICRVASCSAQTCEWDAKKKHGGGSGVAFPTVTRSPRGNIPERHLP